MGKKKQPDGYKYGVTAQRERVYQAFKDYSYDKITQGQLGLILMDCGSKLAMTDNDTQRAIDLFKQEGMI